MEKLNLNAIAKEYYEAEALKAKERAIDLVEKEIIPLLVTAAKAGQHQCRVVVKTPCVYAADVQEELRKRVHCKISRCDKIIVAKW